jgi:alginate O-acetyltransferase complex protein AlgF
MFKPSLRCFPFLLAPIALVGLGLALAAPPLYAPAPPADSAFVRVVNANAGVGLPFTAGGITLEGKLAYGKIGAYRVLKQGITKFEAAGKTSDVKLEAGRFYTLAFSRGHWTTITDRSASDINKARIGVYNFSDRSDVSLKTSDGQLSLLENLESDGYDVVQVNPVKAQLAAFSGGKGMSFPEVQLEANVAYSVVVVGTGKQLRATWVRNATQAQ